MEIKMVHCPNGHYFNAALHSVCPECGMGAAADVSGAGGAGSFGKTEAPGVGGAGSFGKTEAPGAGGAGSFGKTEAPGAGGTGSFGKTEAPGAGGNGSWDGYGGYNGGPTEAAGFTRSDSVDPFPKTEIGGDLANASQVDPVVGWLVCVEGPVRGTDFRIHAGNNYIGREVGDIHIHGDMQISRQNDAMIAFDSEECVYFFGPVAGRNLVKVNGRIVINAQEIHNYDVITLGSSKFLFVALCGEHFGWKKGLTHG